MSPLENSPAAVVSAAQTTEAGPQPTATAAAVVNNVGESLFSTANLLKLSGLTGFGLIVAWGFMWLLSNLMTSSSETNERAFGLISASMDRIVVTQDRFVEKLDKVADKMDAVATEMGEVRKVGYQNQKVMRESAESLDKTAKSLSETVKELKKLGADRVPVPFPAPGNPDKSGGP